VSNWIFFGSSPLSSVGVSGMVVVGVGEEGEGEDGVGVEGIDVVSGGSELFTAILNRISINAIEQQRDKDGKHTFHMRSNIWYNFFWLSGLNISVALRAEV
jgi:hypothetical protein